MRTFLRIAKFVCLTLIFAAETFAADLPQTFTIQGRLLDSTNLVSYTGSVTFKFGIYDPTGACLLYEESQSSIDLGTTGLFALRVGSATGDSKRTSSDPGLAMKSIFNNTATAAIVANGANCSLGGGYTPTANETRVVKVTMTKGGVTTTFSPDLTMNMAPMTQVAQTIQGVGLTGLIQVSGNVTQANLDTLTGTGDASTLHHHDSLYVRNGGSSFGIGNSSPSADIEIKNGAPDFRITGTSNDATAMKIDFFGGASGATQRASIQVLENANTMNFQTGTTQALQLNSTQDALFAGSVSLAGSTALGKYDNSQETTLVTTLTGQGTAALGTFWANSDTNQIKYWDGSAAQVVSSGGSSGLGSLNSLTSASQTLAVANDTNITMTINSAVDTHTFGLGWTGQLGLSRGGTGSNLTAANGGVIYSDATSLQILAAGASGQILSSTGVGAPSWITPTKNNTASTIVMRHTDGSFASGDITIDNGSTSGGTLQLKENSTNGSDSVTIQSPASVPNGASTTLYFPVDIQSGKYLTTDASGNLSWGTPSGSGISSLNGSSNTSQTFSNTNDTNATVAITSSGSNHGFAMGWTSQLALSRGGTGASLTGVNGGLVYSDASKFQVTATGSSGDLLMSQGSTAPGWHTPTSGNTASRVVVRDSAGRAQFADPSDPQDAATKNYTTTRTALYVPLDGSTSMTGALLNKVSLKLEDPGAGTNTSTLVAPTLGANYTLTFPTTAGTSGNILTTTGSGTLTWSTTSSGLSSLNGMTGATQTFGNTANVIITSSSNNHTLGWTGLLNTSRGGTGTDLSSGTYQNGGVVYRSSGTTLATSTTGTSGQVLTSNDTSAPTWTQKASTNTASTIVQRDGSNAFSSGNISINDGTTGPGQLILKEDSDYGSNTYTLKSNATLSSDYTLNLPDSAGSAGSELIVGNASGDLSWGSGGFSKAVRLLNNSVINNSDTLTAVPDLKISGLSSGTSYQMSGALIFTAASNVPGAQFKIQATGASGRFGVTCLKTGAASTVAKASAFSTAVTGLAVAGSGYTVCHFDGALWGATSVQIYWAQDAGTPTSVDSTLVAGSYFHLVAQ